MRLRIFSASLTLLLLTGCNDALIYGERTGFNLAIRVNDDPATPVNVNAGLQRTVVSLAPPLGGQMTDQNRVIAAGESVSAISRFDLKYSETPGGPLTGKLSVRTQFLSGEAAVVATQNPQTATKVVQLITAGRFIASSPTKDQLQNFLGTPPDPARETAMMACAAKLPRLRGMAVPEIVHTDLVTEAERQQIIACLKLNQPA